MRSQKLKGKQKSFEWMQRSGALTPQSLLPTPYSPLPIPHSLFPTPYSPLPIPHSLFPTPYSPLPIPHSLFPTPYSLLLPLPSSLIAKSFSLPSSSSKAPAAPE